MIKWKLFLLLLIGNLFLRAAAQPALSLKISDLTIGSKDEVEATYEFKNISQADFPAVNFKDWDANGPDRSQGMTIINGVTTSSVSYTFTLYPKHMGTLSVPGIQIDLNGKVLKCPGQTVKVVKKEHVRKKPSADNSPFAGILPNLPNMGFPSDIFGSDQDMAPPPVTGVIVHPGQSYQDAAKNDFFIRITPSKRTFYIGEPILVDYEFLGAYNCTWQPERFPSFSGFSVMDIDQSLYPYNQEVNGKRYRVKGMRKAQLVSLKTGDMPLDSASVSLETTFIDANNHADRRTGSIRIKSSPVEVHVLPLPTEHQPADFSGAIGHFSITASVDKNKLPAGENDVLHIRIGGTGNLDGVGVPAVQWPKLLQAYDAKDSQSVNKASFPMDKVLTFDIPFIANQKGGVVIPAIVFNYFDPEKKAYVSDSSDKIQLEFTEALQDNGIAEALSQNHTTNRGYLWIVALIALIVLLILLVSEYRKRKAAKRLPAKIKAEQLIPMSSTDADRSVPAVDLQTPGLKDADVAASLKDLSRDDSARYLPPKLAQKMQEEAQRLRQQQGLNKPAGDNAGDGQDQDELTPTAPPKTRQELLAESLKELEEKSDLKEFFFLAKAFLIQHLQDLSGSQETDDQALLHQLSGKDPEKSAQFRKLIANCNKSIYLPFNSEKAAESRDEMLAEIRHMVQSS